MSKDLNFPHGRLPPSIPLPAIIICKNGYHREEVVKAFPIAGAMYILPFEAIVGWRTNRLIIFRPSLLSAKEEDEFHLWITKRLPLALTQDKGDQIFWV